MKTKILLVLLVACGAVQAAEWVSLGKLNDGKAEGFIDESSIRVAGGIRQAWFKTIMAAHPLRGTADNGEKWVSYLLTRTAYNCSEETSRDEAQDQYFTDGTMVIAPAAYFPAAWQPLAPDTYGSIQMQFICAWKPK